MTPSLCQSGTAKSMVCCLDDNKTWAVLAGSDRACCGLLIVSYVTSARDICVRLTGFMCAEQHGRIINNQRKPSPLSPPPQLSTLELCKTINIFHCSMVYHFYVWNSLQIVCILIFWSDDYNGWKTQTADAGDSSPLSSLGRDKLLCNPDLIFFQQFPNLISLSQGTVHGISEYFEERKNIFSCF